MGFNGFLRISTCWQMKSLLWNISCFASTSIGAPQVLCLSNPHPKCCSPQWPKQVMWKRMKIETIKNGDFPIKKWWFSIVIWDNSTVYNLVGGLEHEFYDFPYIGNGIIPTDELIFFREVGIPPTRWWTMFPKNWVLSGTIFRIRMHFIS